MLQEAEVAKLTALLQKSEMKAKSLELTVEQKVKENEVGSYSFGSTNFLFFNFRNLQQSVMSLSPRWGLDRTSTGRSVEHHY